MAPSVPKFRSLFIAAITLVPLALAGGCGEDGSSSGSADRGLGESCSGTGDCRAGLACAGGTCQTAGTGAQGSACTLTGECGDGLFCASGVPTGVCTPAGTAEVDGSCSTNADCLPGLFCNYRGFAGLCADAGTVDIRGACTTTADCAASLGCGPGGVCLPGIPAGGFVFYEGATCPEPGIPEGGSFNVLFNVPRTGQPVTEFYSLPFPNVIRQRGHIDLSGHPRPELDDVGNVLKTLIEQIEEDVDGFGLHQAVFIRFNLFPDSSTLTIEGASPALSIVNIEPDSQRYAQRTNSIAWSGTDGRGNFICHNYIAVRTAFNDPFAPNTTYAVIITDGVRGRDGEVPAQAPDFAAVIGPTRPSDNDLAAAWDDYQVFRDYLADQSISPATIMGAAVFTTGDPAAHIDGLADGVTTPSNGDLVLCDDGVVSPCDDGLTGEEHTRGCFGTNPAFHEIHTTIDMPVFQAGTAPYFESGGGLLYDNSGTAIPQLTTPVCTAITIPAGRTMPEGGWPVAVYAHGTGGNFRSHVDELAADLAGIGYAMIGYDGVQHGTRRGDSDLDPAILFFNFLNPRAAAGNVLQSGADLIAVGNWARDLAVAGGASPTAEPIAFDDTLIGLIGHSQGATAANVALAAVNHPYAAHVNSGGGGGLLLSLLDKTEPINIAAGIEVVLQDGEVDEYHPVMNLVQLYFESADPINFGHTIILDRPEGANTPHLFLTMGIGDSYTPNSTAEQLIHAIGLPLLTPVIDDFGRPTVTPPVRGNLGGGTITAAAGQYQPAAGQDGHFVLFDNQTARNQMIGFFESLLIGVPEIP